MLLNKVCEVEDFTDPELSELMLRFLPRPIHSTDEWPRGQEDRKFWEISMALLAVIRHLPAGNRVHALGVGAGLEATSFILTSLFKQVFATDLYGGKSWKADSSGMMLTKPEAFSGRVPFNPRRLVTQHMDGRFLRYEDNTFDFIYSSSSIEHFGSAKDIATAMKEMHRVLRPNGIISISTEFSISGKSQWLGSHTLLFDEKAIGDIIVEASGCSLVDEQSFAISSLTRDCRSDFGQALKDLESGGNRLDQKWSTYPHIVIADADMMWTSVHICLQKTT